MIWTRRFFALFAAVVFGAMGKVAPMPDARIRSAETLSDVSRERMT
jgi:hypothetical protein